MASFEALEVLQAFSISQIASITAQGNDCVDFAKTWAHI